jgi:hypothetical protein
MDEDKRNKTDTGRTDKDSTSFAGHSVLPRLRAFPPGGRLILRLHSFLCITAQLIVQLPPSPQLYLPDSV